MTFTTSSHGSWILTGEMKPLFHARTVVATLALLGQPAMAQSEKEFKTNSGTPVIIVNLVSARPDCSSNPGPIAVPVIREKPTNGNVRMQVVATDIAASQSCPARKIPTIALVYTSTKDFVGTDSAQVEIEEDTPSLLDHYLSGLRAEEQVHNGQGAADIAMGARSRP